MQPCCAGGGLLGFGERAGALPVMKFSAARNEAGEKNPTRKPHHIRIGGAFQEANSVFWRAVRVAIKDPIVVYYRKQLPEGTARKTVGGCLGPGFAAVQISLFLREGCA